MSLAPALLLSLLAGAAPTPSAPSQEPEAQRLKPLVPPPAGGAPEAPASRSFQVDVGVGPRPLPVEEPPPFLTDRTLFEVDGVPITSAELNELVLYYRSFRPGATELLLIDAFAALLPSKVMQARFAAELPAMRERAEAARAAVAAGRPFAEVVKEFSDDGEAEHPEAQYEFGRERAVQPFDRASFTLAPGSGLQGPFLTVYGWHLIEPLAYARGLTPKDDRATMRHVLVMYPRQRELDAAGEDLRAWIRARVAEARIRVLEPGLANLVPPERRAQIQR